jgi:AraC-like DNA-binding protein
VITTSNNKSYEIGAGEAVFLPKGLNLYSDYIHDEHGLKAYLLFFGQDVLSRFLSSGHASTQLISNEEAIFKLERNRAIKEYFTSLRSVYGTIANSPDLLQLKLLELLYLLDIQDDGALRNSLLSVQRGSAKRNIRRLMDQYAVSDLTAKDLAVLSGRSTSTFNREFKSIYGTTPKQWLIDRRMSHAHSLLSDKRWSVTAVALEVGYSNVSHFIEVFKKKYGKTPYQLNFNA